MKKYIVYFVVCCALVSASVFAEETVKYDTAFLPTIFYDATTNSYDADRVEKTGEVVVQPGSVVSVPVLVSVSFSNVTPLATSSNARWVRVSCTVVVIQSSRSCVSSMFSSYR